MAFSISTAEAVALRATHVAGKPLRLTKSRVPNRIDIAAGFGWYVFCPFVRPKEAVSEFQWPQCVPWLYSFTMRAAA